jgi:hypothetical protein
VAARGAMDPRDIGGGSGFDCSSEMWRAGCWGFVLRLLTARDTPRLS